MHKLSLTNQHPSWPFGCYFKVLHQCLEFLNGNENGNSKVNPHMANSTSLSLKCTSKCFYSCVYCSIPYQLNEAVFSLQFTYTKKDNITKVSARVGEISTVKIYSCLGANRWLFENNLGTVFQFDLNLGMNCGSFKNDV